MSPALIPERKLNLSPMARAVLLGCQTACHADEFAQKLVSSAAAVFEADFCIWADAGDSGLDPVALTPGAEAVLPHALTLAGQTIREGPFNSGNLVAAPTRFRSQVTGVLLAGRGLAGFTCEHLKALMVIGRAAVARYEQLRLAEELALSPGSDPSGVIACLVHELSQPLSVIGAAAFYLNMVLPPSEAKLRLHLERMEEQVDIAARLLQNASRSVRPWAPDSRPEPNGDKCDLTKAASSSLV